jgi:peptide/nickel transport system substrate-binding protein
MNTAPIPKAAARSPSFFDGVASVETPDDLTVVVTFEGPTPFPLHRLRGRSESPVIQAAQFADCLGARAPECTEANFGPIGTGPFVVTEFRPNDVIEFSANPNYRDPDQAGLCHRDLQGRRRRGVAAARSGDRRVRLRLEPADGSRRSSPRWKPKAATARSSPAFGPSVERLHLNQTNPDPALGDDRSTAQAGPHPFLTNPVIGQAMSMAIDRALLVEVGYGAGGQPTCNVLPGARALCLDRQ